jgi:hypothetical protein
LSKFFGEKGGHNFGSKNQKLPAWEKKLTHSGKKFGMTPRGSELDFFTVNFEKTNKRHSFFWFFSGIFFQFTSHIFSENEKSKPCWKEDFYPFFVFRVFADDFFRQRGENINIFSMLLSFFCRLKVKVKVCILKIGFFLRKFVQKCFFCIMRCVR